MHLHLSHVLYVPLAREILLSEEMVWFLFPILQQSTIDYKLLVDPYKTEFHWNKNLRDKNRKLNANDLDLMILIL